MLIGSLYWEDKGERKRWRENHLDGNWRNVPIGIRYGRQSTTRNNTYTMILSKTVDARSGTAKLCGAKTGVVSSGDDLFAEAKAMALAEGMQGGGIVTNWGVVGLMLNPASTSSQNEVVQQFSTYWEQQSSQIKFDKFGKHGLLQASGILTVDWQPEYDDYDVILCTQTKPTNEEAGAEEIAERMNRASFFDYFCKNVSHGITTFQDHEIKKLIPPCREC